MQDRKAPDFVRNQAFYFAFCASCTKTGNVQKKMVQNCAIYQFRRGEESGNICLNYVQVSCAENRSTYCYPCVAGHDAQRTPDPGDGHPLEPPQGLVGVQSRARLESGGLLPHPGGKMWLSGLCRAGEGAPQSMTFPPKILAVFPLKDDGLYISIL